MTLVIAILQALIATPKIGGMVNAWIAQVFAWYVTTQNEANGKAIADAAAFSLRAQTKEERLEAAKKWQDALSRRSPK